MSYVPSAFVEMGYGWLVELKWPANRVRIAFMSLENKQKWLLAQDPQTLIDLGLDAKFVAFWDRCYILPLKIKRFLYKAKFW